MNLLDPYRAAAVVSLMIVTLAACSDEAANSPATVHPQMKSTTGPPTGSLVVVGGNLQDPAIIERFLLVRNRQFDLLEIIEARPELLGLGLDEDTAIVVNGDQFEVIGQGYVAIYDHERITGKDGQFYLLMPGDRFDMKTRTPLRPNDDSEPFAVIREEAWQR